MSLADDLRTAGLVVVEGRPFGSPDASSIDVKITGTGQSLDGADDVNEIVVPRRGQFYVRRSGEVWMLAVGPSDGGAARVFVAAYRDDSITDEQQDALDALLAVLSVAYGLDAPEAGLRPGDGDGAPDAGDESGDDE